MAITSIIYTILLFSIAIWSTIAWVGSVIYSLAIVGAVVIIVLENRNPLRSLAWLSIVVLLPAVGLILYLFFGRSMRNRRMISRRNSRRLRVIEGGQRPDVIPESYSPQAHDLIVLARNLNKSVYTNGNTVEIFIDGKDKFQRLLADLRSAKNYILLQYYIIADDKIGSEVADTLIERARCGVKVRVIYDHLACIKVDSHFFNRMKEAGIEIEPFFRLSFPKFASRANWRNHRKLCVIDGIVGYIGGMNIADRYIDGGSKFNMWRDCHLRLKGPCVAALHQAFAIDWSFIGQPLPIESLPQSRALEATNQESSGIQIVTGGPIDDNRNLSEIMLKAIATARERVYIQTPYFLPSAALMSALRTASLSNVDVRIMIPRRSDSWLMTLASHSYIQECLRCNIKIYFFEPGMLHSKVMVVDDEISTVGSTNFDYRSFELNFEANAVIYSRIVNKRLRKMFLHDSETSTRIHFAPWRRRPFHIRATESVVRLLSPLL